MRFHFTATLACVLVASGCDGGSASDDDAGARCPATQPRMFVTLSDYQSGTLCGLAPGEDCHPVCDAAAVTSDTVLATDGGRLVLINSSTDYENVTYFSLGGAMPTVTWRVAVGTLSDESPAFGDARAYLPLAADRAFVTRMLRPRLAVLNPAAAPPTARAGTDLSMLAEGAAQLAPYRMALVDGRVWVSLLRLDNGLESYSVRGAIALVDPASESLVDADAAMAGVQPIELPFGNPVGVLNVLANGTVRIACSGSLFDATDGGLVEIDGAPPFAVRTLLTETEAGGNIDAAVALDEHRVLLRIVAQEEAPPSRAIDHVSLAVFDDRIPHGVSAPWLTVHEWTLTEPILARNGTVYVGDRGEPYGTPPRASGLRAFDAQTGSELTPQPIAVGTPSPGLNQPYSLIEAP